MSLNSGDFLRAVIFLHRRLRARDCRFRGRLVDAFGFERHVGQDGNRVARDLDKTFADRERQFRAPSLRTRSSPGSSVVSSGTCFG